MTAPDTEKLIMLASIRQRALFGPVVGTLFETYDVDASGSLEMDEVRTMIKIASAMKTRPWMRKKLWNL